MKDGERAVIETFDKRTGLTDSYMFYADGSQYDIETRKLMRIVLMVDLYRFKAISIHIHPAEPATKTYRVIRS